MLINKVVFHKKQRSEMDYYCLFVDRLEADTQLFLQSFCILFMIHSVWKTAAKYVFHILLLIGIYLPVLCVAEVMVEVTSHCVK